MDIRDIPAVDDSGPDVAGLELPPDAGVQHWSRADEGAQRLLANAMERFGLSGRARQRVLRVARTIADLAGVSAVTAVHVGEALSLRCLDDRGAIAPSAPCGRPPV